jgi:hypothetical protein
MSALITTLTHFNIKRCDVKRRVIFLDHSVILPSPESGSIIVHIGQSDCQGDGCPAMSAILCLRGQIVSVPPLSVQLIRGTVSYYASATFVNFKSVKDISSTYTTIVVFISLVGYDCVCARACVCMREYVCFCVCVHTPPTDWRFVSRGVSHHRHVPRSITR